MRTLCTLLALMLATPALAQDSDPFPLPHPETGEPGEWTPAWLVREHVKIERDLLTCIDARGVEHQARQARDREIAHREAALEEQKEATAQSEARNVALQQQIEEVEKEREVSRSWMWASLGGTVVGVVLFAIRESLR